MKRPNKEKLNLEQATRLARKSFSFFARSCKKLLLMNYGTAIVIIKYETIFVIEASIFLIEW